MYGYFEMKFALGAAAAITGASALIYLLLRPRKRQLDPGKQNVSAVKLTSLKDSYGDKASLLREEHVVQKKSEDRECDQKRNDTDNFGYQNFNGHVSEDASVNSSHDSARCKISVLEQDCVIDDDGISSEEVAALDCLSARKGDTFLPCSFDDKLHSDIFKDNNDEDCTGVQNDNECSASFTRQITEESPQSVDHTNIQEGIISSTAECDASECTSDFFENKQRASNLDCDSTAAISHVTSSSFSEKEYLPFVHDPQNTIHTLPLQEVSQTVNNYFAEPERVTSSAAKNECVSSDIKSDIGNGMSSISNLSDNEDLQKAKDNELEKKVIESTSFVGMDSEKITDISQAEVGAESCKEDDSVTIKASLVENHSKLEVESPAVEISITEELTTSSENRAVTELLFDKSLETPTAKLPGTVSADFCESLEGVSKAEVFVTSAGESSEIKTVKECECEADQFLTANETGSGRTAQTDMCSQSEKMQAECAEVTEINVGLKSSTDSQHTEAVVPKELVTSIMSEEKEPADCFKSKSMWSEYVDNSPRTSVAEESPISVYTHKEQVSCKGDKDSSEENKKEVVCKLSEFECAEEKVLKYNAEFAHKDKQQSSDNLETHSNTEVNDTLSSNQELSDLCESSSRELGAQEPISMVAKEYSPPSDSNSQRKKSYKNRVRNSHGGSSSSASESSTRNRMSEEGTCLDLKKAEKELCSIIEDNQSNSLSSFAVTPSDNKAVESQSVSPCVGESDTGAFCTDEPISVVTKENSPASVGNSQKKKSYKDRVRNSYGSTSSSASDTSPKKTASTEGTCPDADQAEKELCSVIEDTADNSVSSFEVREKAATLTNNKVVESVPVSPPVREIVIVDNKELSTSTKKEPGSSKSSKPKKEGPPKSSETTKTRSYKERTRNSRGNSVSETVQISQEEDQNSDNGGRNLKSTESSQSSSSEIEPETLFNPSAFPVSSQVQYIFYEFEIPQVLVGRLIGRKGAFVNKIKAATDATIVVGPHKNRKYKICTVEGSREQVNLALDMIREYFPLSRYPDLSLEQVYNCSPATAPPVETAINSQAMQIELAAGVVVEVRVSAVVSGNELWVQQPLHPSYSALQRLQSCMNINYGDGSNTPPLAPHIREGIICVSQINSQWYRCQVLSVSDDFALIVLLDVGGTISIPVSELRQIRRDYMMLPFQAAQCLLHGIQPVSEEGWDETSAVVLEELVSGAILFATVVSYTQDGVPLVNLYRRDQDEYVYLNERLVNLGHAQWITPATST